MIRAWANSVSLTLLHCRADVDRRRIADPRTTGSVEASELPFVLERFAYFNLNQFGKSFVGFESRRVGRKQKTFFLKTRESHESHSTGSKRVAKSRQLVDEIAAKGEPVYGINTGFGNFATVSIPDDRLSELQENLITSHAAGTGVPLSVERTRMLLALRINVLAKGFRCRFLYGCIDCAMS